MKSTGIVRRIDELGRVVIPKELRRTLKLREGEELEVFAGEDSSLVLKKFSAVKELLPFGNEYVSAVYESTGFTAVLTDLDCVVAVAGDMKVFSLGDALPRATDVWCSERKTVGLEGIDLQNWLKSEMHGSAVIAPVLRAGDLHGYAIVFSKKPLSELQFRTADTAANFFARSL